MFGVNTVDTRSDVELEEVIAVSSAMIDMQHRPDHYRKMKHDAINELSGRRLAVEAREMGLCQ